MKKLLLFLTLLVSVGAAIVFASGYQNVSGEATTATALAANGTNCGAGLVAAGVDASGNAEGCIAGGAPEVDPTVDTSAEIQAIIGAGVYSASGAVMAEVDPTVDTSAEVQAIIGAGVYATAAQGGLADTALQAEVDPTVDTSAEIQAIIGAGVYATSAQGGLADTALQAETDPGINTLTNTKWCTTDGSVINCTSDAPSGLLGSTTSDGTANTSVGYLAGAGIVAGMIHDTFIGTQAGGGGSMQQWADALVAVGYMAMGNAQYPSSSVAVGTNALKVASIGYQMVAVGTDSQIASTTAQRSVSMGAYAMGANTTGNDNTCVGDTCLGALVGAYNKNTAIGSEAGRFKSDGFTSATSLEQCTIIGAFSKTLNVNDTNSITLGYLALGKGSNTAVIGNSSVTSLHLGTKVVSAPAAPVTLAAAATTFVVTAPLTILTGDGDGNTLATITGGYSGQNIVIKFVDAEVAVTDTDADTADTINLSAALTGADNTMLSLTYDGTKWFETSRSVNG